VGAGLGDAIRVQVLSARGLASATIGVWMNLARRRVNGKKD
jgi:hypothetical protein